MEGSGNYESSTDMFADSPVGGWKLEKNNNEATSLSTLNDNWDDHEGRYRFHPGEIMDGRYRVLASHGSGVFSTVIRAQDLKANKNDHNEVAIKIIRNNDFMHKCGLKEVEILKRLNEADPNNKRHCVQLLSSFQHRNHLCLVFESLHTNLRGIQKKLSYNIGITRAYAKQLFIALEHLQKCGVLHCDIKPDNILINDAMTTLKLCDFGSAMRIGPQIEIQPYLVSRFYRAPEIILGLPYNHAIDMWSVGCCLYELYSGDVLFKGMTNTHMLQLHMELKGVLPKKLLKKAELKNHYFDQNLNLYIIEEDSITKKLVKKIVKNDHFSKPKGMGHFIVSMGSQDKWTTLFTDLLERIFILDPNKRLTVVEALNHPFISEQ